MIFRLNYCTIEMMLLYVCLLETTLGRLKIKKIRKMKDVKEFHKNLTAPDVAKESFQIKRLWRELHNIRYFTGNVMKTTK